MNDQPTPESVARRPLQMRREQFTFTGTAREYFGIWIVNVLLTIVTLGIYSAWAKVRRQRYFYGNTRLDGVPFEYPVTVCDACIRLVVGACPLPMGTPVLSGANGCNQAQDGMVTCCSNGTTLVCPAQVSTTVQ